MQPTKPRKLSRRQKQILVLVLRGQKPQQISSCLDLSVHTVREHIKAIYLKFGVRKREQLAAIFLERAIRRIETSTHVSPHAATRILRKERARRLATQAEAQ